ncbi:ComF family protein [Pseudoalteromonas sp. SSDWG2]|uniref:ComF family protein n=1 Tax=Pseudoalteromonas sp. SSDWG2 TaxID=3139391 RepID=UPI003BAC9125
MSFTGIDANNSCNLLTRADIQRQFTLPNIDKLFAVDWYKPPLSIWLKRLKYQQRMYYQKAITQLIVQHLAHASTTPNWQWPDIISPVPCAPAKLLWRGFNQVASLWQHALPNELFMTNLLSRSHSFHPQASLNAAQRRKNLKHVFKLHGDVSNKHVVLVDDILTTGSTANTVAKLLKDANAASVAVWVVCLTPKE